MLGASRAAILGASNSGGGIEYGWQTGISGYTASSVFAPNDTLTYTAPTGWGTCGLMDLGLTSGKWSVDIEIVAVASPSRVGFGVSRVSNIAPYCPNAIYSSENNAFCKGIDCTGTLPIGTIVTLDIDFTGSAISMYQDNVYRAGPLTFTPGGNTWYVAADEYEDNPSWRLVPEVYAPRAGFTKINP